MEEYDDIKKMLTPTCNFHASETLRKRVCDTLGKRRRKKHISLWIWRMCAACAAAAVLVFVLLPARISAKGVLTEAIATLMNFGNVEMKVEIRTRPMENFEYINLNDGFVDHKIVVAKDDSTFKWRIDKGGRVAVGINADSYSWIDNLGIGWHFKGANPEELMGYLAVLLSPEKIFESELRECTDGSGSGYSVSKKGENLILTVSVEPQGDFSNPYRLNTSIVESKSIRRYVFDSKTKQLRSASVGILSGDKEITVLRISSVRYNIVRQEAFSIPKNIRFIDVADSHGVQGGLSCLTATEAASAVLNAFRSWDTSIIDIAIDPELAEGLFKETLSGAKLQSIGRAFRSGNDGNTFVPYTLKLRDGSEKKHNLVMRQTDEGRWIVVGGL